MMHRCQLYWLGHAKVEKKIRILSCNRDTECDSVLRSPSIVACWDVPLSLIILPVCEIWDAVSLCGPCAVLEHQLSR